MSYHHSYYDSPGARPRAPSYTGLPPHHSHQLPKQLDPIPLPPTSASPSAYSTYATSPAYTRPPSISASSLSSSSYAGSAEDESLGEREVDMVDLLAQRLSHAFDPITMDRSLAMQTQTSGMLNSRTRELDELREEAQRKLKETRKAFAEGMRCAKEVRRDLEVCHKKVKALKQKAERKYPVEYNMARERMPPPLQ